MRKIQQSTWTFFFFFFKRDKLKEWRILLTCWTLQQRVASDAGRRRQTRPGGQSSKWPRASRRRWRWPWTRRGARARRLLRSSQQSAKRARGGACPARALWAGSEGRGSRRRPVDGRTPPRKGLHSQEAGHAFRTPIRNEKCVLVQGRLLMSWFVIWRSPFLTKKFLVLSFYV